MPFNAYNQLRLFDVVARHLSFTAAAKELNRTKGAISYQINQLEQALGFRVFDRRNRRITLTDKGARLWQTVQISFGSLDREITSLREHDLNLITVGASTYFASRWLSPRLMRFIERYPEVGLRLQSSVNLEHLHADNINLAIRWGKGHWPGLNVEPLLALPSRPTAGPGTHRRVSLMGLEQALASMPLLHDNEQSVAWQDWHKEAGLTYNPVRDALVIPDPNVRVQAVMNDQGIALTDSLLDGEMEAGRLIPISSTALPHYGYFLTYRDGALANENIRLFRDWIHEEARGEL